jgi:hypothetical protein
LANRIENCCSWPPTTASRSERSSGRYLKVTPGRPSRPAGNKLNEYFLGDMLDAWVERGREAIDRVIDERPDNKFNLSERAAHPEKLFMRFNGSFLGAP